MEKCWDHEGPKKQTIGCRWRLYDVDGKDVMNNHFLAIGARDHIHHPSSIGPTVHSQLHLRWTCSSHQRRSPMVPALLSLLPLEWPQKLVLFRSRDGYDVRVAWRCHLIFVGPLCAVTLPRKGMVLTKNDQGQEREFLSSFESKPSKT